jgi:hypothetical protein
MCKVKVVEQHRIYDSTWSAELAGPKEIGAEVDKAGRFRIMYVTRQLSHSVD